MVRLIPVLLMLVCALPAFAQITAGSITGTVTDPTQLPIGAATVTVRSEGTGQQILAQTNSAGVYVVPSLVPGSYTVEVNAAGFKANRITGADVEGGQRLRLDVQLQLGATQEMITVEGTAPPLMQESAEISKTVTATEVRNLPVFNRNPYQLMLITPGFVSPRSGNSVGGSTYMDAVSFNGSRAFGSRVTIDGAPMQSIQGAGESLGSIEAIREVKVLTGTYSAEYGRTAGGVVNFQVKSGTTEFHGSLYEFNRNSALDANLWGNNARGVRRPVSNRNQFGGTFGGPVPMFRDKLFFFVSHESDRNASPITRLRTIPDPSVRRGDFSGVSRAVINDPTTGAPFPRNIIPPSRLDPAAVRLMELFPAPNQIGNLSSQFDIRTNNWLRVGSSRTPSNFTVFRFDANATDKDRIFLTFSRINEGVPDAVPEFENALNTVDGGHRRTLLRTTAGYTRIFAPSLTGDFTFSMQRDPLKRNPIYEFDVVKDLGMAKSAFAGMPRINISGGFGAYGNNRTVQSINQPITTSAIGTYLRGRHTLRFGAQYEISQYSYYTTTNSSAGDYSFTGEITGLGAAGRNNPWNAVADLLLGSIKTANAVLPQIPIARQNSNVGLFLNDDWKLTDRLTANLGLRYEYERRQFVRNNVYSRADLSTGGLLVAGRNASRNLNLNEDLFNLGPRVGLAYTVNRKTVVRSGFGVFYSNFWIDNGTEPVFPGFTYSQSFQDPGVGRPQPFRFVDGLPITNAGSVPDPLQLFGTATVDRPFSITSVTYNPTDQLPYNMQWSASVQREIGFGSVLDVAYVGSRSVHLSRNVAGNNLRLEQAPSVVLNRQPVQPLRPFPTLSNFNAVFYDANASYHSLQVALKRRFRAGLSLDAAYTFSKNIDTASQRGDSFQIPWQFFGIEKAVSNMDRTNVFTLAWVYDLPFGKGKPLFSGNRVLSAALGGFRWNGILSTMDGRPLTITQELTNLILASQRPNVKDPSNLAGKVSDPFFTGIGARRWLIEPTAADFPFTPSSNIGIGNLGRNTSRAPGFWQLDLGIFRVLPIRERVNLEMRFEAFNATNHVNFEAPASTTMNNPNYGLITGTTSPRVLQIGARLSF